MKVNHTEAMKLALEHAKRDERHLNHAETRYWCRMYRDIAEKAVEALAKPDFWEGYVPEPVKPAQPVAMRLPKVGDEVVCIEDESLGVIAYLTAGGSPEIRFDDGSHGTYVLREFAELFRYTSPPAQQSCYCPNCEALSKELAELKAQQPFGYFKAEPFGWTDCAETDEGAVALYERPPAQRTWVGLTDEEVSNFVNAVWPREATSADYIRAIEAKLKEKNT